MKNVVLLSLNNSFLTNIGKHSYAMYIIHSPISLTLHSYYSTNHFWEKLGDDRLLKTLAIITDLMLLFILTYALARITWALIEKPCLDLKHKFD